MVRVERQYHYTQVFGNSKREKKFCDGVQIKFPPSLKPGQFAETNRRKIAASRTEVIDLKSHQNCCKKNSFKIV